MKRVLALVAAVAMVGGAFVVRSKVIDSSDDSNDDSGRPSGGSALTVGCAPELTEVCAAVAGKDIKVFGDPIDLNNAAPSASKIDAWLTYGPAPGMVNASASGQGTVFDDGTVIGSGQIAVVSPADRLLALAKRCRLQTTTLTWKCLAESAGLNWADFAPGLQGTVKIGVGDPSSALHAILIGPMASATAGLADPGIDDIKVPTIRRVVASVDQQPSQDELTDLTLRGPAAYSAVVAPRESAKRAAASVRGQSLGLQVLYPGPVATTVVVLAPPSGQQISESLRDAFDQPEAKAALSRAGWTPAKQGRTAGLPAPDVLYALRQAVAR